MWAISCYCSTKRHFLGGRSDYGAAIRSVWLCTPVPPALLAEIVREWLPASVGLPLMRPVVALMVRPDGRLVVA